MTASAPDGRRFFRKDGSDCVTKFEQVGVDLQYSSVSKRDAVQKFGYSCRVCCNRGMKIDCDKCAIAATHAITIAAMDSVAGVTPKRIS